MEKSKWIKSGIAILIYMTIVAFFVNDFNEYRRGIQDIKEGIKLELKTIYNTEGVRVLDRVSGSNEYVRYEVLVEDKIKQVIYLKDTSEIKVID